MESKGEHARAAALALFYLDLDRAVLALTRAAAHGSANATGLLFCFRWQLSTLGLMRNVQRHPITRWSPWRLPDFPIVAMYRLTILFGSFLFFILFFQFSCVYC
jgi:hypothetical protein